MRLFDTNIVIYATKAEHQNVQRFMSAQEGVVSAVSYVESLGFHRLAPADKADLEVFFATAIILPVTQPVLERAVRLRQARKLSLGDALIAATCPVHGLVLVTRNTEDFSWIGGLELLNPFELPGQPDVF